MILFVIFIPCSIKFTNVTRPSRRHHDTILKAGGKKKMEKKDKLTSVLRGKIRRKNRGGLELLSMVASDNQITKNLKITNLKTNV